MKVCKGPTDSSVHGVKPSQASKFSMPVTSPSLPIRHCVHRQPLQQLISLTSHFPHELLLCLTRGHDATWPSSLPQSLSVFWPWACMVTGACPSSASPSTWRSPARRLRPCRWAEGWPAPCPRSRSRWSRTTTRTSTTTARGTWAARPRCEAETGRLVDATMPS